ncbi:hypothetical protein AXK11_09060 [Cephaloticoccus primus]|uniref:NADP-dependent oxidoreductase domain-containing protein n=2 Tax=Cephaloticoccus primus TaxID=1548207 RepID=A0A139SHW1_9BACT|nr:hypothetical protein AXK11_09060 [Cephaloticoccus primus]
MGTGAAYRTPHAEVEEALRVGLSLGMRAIDTAENYGKGGDVERVVGRAITGQREQVYLITKVDPKNATSRQAIRHSCERSLRNLGTDYIDLYLLHWPVENLSLVVNEFEALKAEGLIRNWGVSNFYLGDMERLYAIPGGKHCAVNQVGYSLADRKIEAQGLVDWAAKRRLPLMAHSPLGRVGKLMQSPIMGEVAARHGVSTSAVAAAWTMRSGSVISIPGSPRVKYARENARAAELTLDAADLAKLDQAFPVRPLS